MKRYKLQIQLVSGQMVPNVTPVMDPAISPEKVILCTSSNMEKHAKFLERFLKKRKIESEIFKIGDALDFKSLKDKFLNLLLQNSDRKEDLWVNLTGGTKLMTLAASEVFRNLEQIPCFYVLPERNSLILLDSRDSTQYELSCRMKIEDFFEIHGYQVEKICRKTKYPEQIAFFAENLLAGYRRYSPVLGSLNYFASAAAKAQSLYCELDHRICSQGNAIHDLLRLAEDSRLIESWDDRSITFRDEWSRDACRGFWLEEYAMQKLQKLHQSLHLQDFAKSIQFISPDGVRNELDAAFLYRNTLCILECKTCNTMEKGKGAEIIYKLDSLKALPGIFTKAAVLSFQDLESAEKKRAADRKLKTIIGPALPNLEKHLQQMVQM